MNVESLGGLGGVDYKTGKGWISYKINDTYYTPKRYYHLNSSISFKKAFDQRKDDLLEFENNLKFKMYSDNIVMDSEKPKTKTSDNKKAYDVKYLIKRYATDEAFRENKKQLGKAYYEANKERIKEQARLKYHQNKNKINLDLNIKNT